MSSTNVDLQNGVIPTEMKMRSGPNECSMERISVTITTTTNEMEDYIYIGREENRSCLPFNRLRLE